MESLRGKLLLAAPTLLDPNFRRTVVLVSEHSEEGAMGVVLNRPSQTTVGEAVAQLELAVDADEPVFVGGPVQPTSIVLLAEFVDPEQAALIVFGRVGFPSSETGIDDLAEVTDRGRVFAGYAGWGPGQLDAELEQGDWFVEAARPEDVFSDEAAGLWSSVLARKGGQFALVATMPLDPSLN